MALPKGFLDYINKKVPEAQFVDEDDFESFIANEEEEGEDIRQMWLDKFNAEAAHDDQLATDRAAVDTTEDDPEYTAMITWAESNYEPASGMTADAIMDKADNDDAWAEELAKAYYVDNLSDDNGEDIDGFVEKEDVNNDGDIDTVTVGEEKESDDGDSKEVIETTVIADDTDEADESMKNILSALSEHRY